MEARITYSKAREYIEKVDSILDYFFLGEEIQIIRKELRNYYHNFLTSEEEKQMEREYNKEGGG